MINLITVQNKYSGLWSFGPEHLRQVMELDDDETGYQSQGDAKDAAKQEIARLKVTGQMSKPERVCLDGEVLNGQGS